MVIALNILCSFFKAVKRAAWANNMRSKAQRWFVEDHELADVSSKFPYWFIMSKFFFVPIAQNLICKIVRCKNV